jgi:hypothetical protein
MFGGENNLIHGRSTQKKGWSNCIPKERALCIFFSEGYSKENVARLTQRLAAMKDLDLCYTNDPRLPMLMSLARMSLSLSLFFFFFFLHLLSIFFAHCHLHVCISFLSSFFLTYCS